MATIERRISKDGSTSYRVKIRARGHPPVTRSFRRKSDAERFATTTEADILAGRYKWITEAQRRTFDDLCREYIRHVLPLQPKCAGRKRQHLTYWQSRFGSRWLSDITPAFIVEGRNDLLTQDTRFKRKRSNATVVRYLATLSHVFSIAVRDLQWMDENPVRKITKPREPRGRERFLSDQEREQLLNACQQSRSPILHTVVVLALSTGMRSGEIMQLTWSDVDFVRESITLRETKNGATRGVPIIGLAKALLQDLSKVRRIDTHLVFPGKRGDKPVELRRPWLQALKVAGIQNFRFHDLRHSAASYLAMNGATTVELAAVLGHKTLVMVQRYSHLSKSHTHQIVKAMNEKVFGQVKRA